MMIWKHWILLALLATACSDSPRGRASAVLRPGAIEQLEEGVLIDLLQARADDSFGLLRWPVDQWWQDLDDARRAALLGGALRFEQIVRRRYTKGRPIWAELSLRVPVDLPGIERLWLVTDTARPRVDGTALDSRSWPQGQSLAVPWTVNLDLSTLVGDRLGDAGRHTVTIAFDARIQLLQAGGSIDESVSLWSGTLSAAEVSFEVVPAPPEDLLEAVSASMPDPSRVISIVMHGRGGKVVLWPPPSEQQTLDLGARLLLATVRIGTTRRITAGLGFDVMATPAGGGKAFRLGRLSAAGLSPFESPTRAGTFDLSELLANRDEVTLVLELVPSVLAAYRNPRIESFWDQRLKLGTVCFRKRP